jgi:hypothetical protein
MQPVVTLGLEALDFLRICSELIFLETILTRRYEATNTRMKQVKE